MPGIKSSSGTGAFVPCTWGSRAVAHCSFLFCLPALETRINPSRAGWYFRSSSGEILLLVTACHQEKGEQDRQKTTQIPQMNEEEETHNMTGWGGKTARWYLTRQKNRETKTEQPNYTPVTTKNLEGELKASIDYERRLDIKGPDANRAVVKLRHYIKWWPSGATVKLTMPKTNERLENAGGLSLVGREEQTVKS